MRIPLSAIGTVFASALSGILTSLTVNRLRGKKSAWPLSLYRCNFFFPYSTGTFFFFLKRRKLPWYSLGRAYEYD